MNPFDAIIFDMDGVIVDSEPLHERAFRALFAELGFPGESHGINFPEYYGRSDEAVWRDFIARHSPALSRDELITRKRTTFLALLKEEEPLFDGLPELLELLSARYPLAIASGSGHPVIDGVLALRGIRRHFKAVVSAQDVGREKPQPDIFLEAARRLGVEPARCWVVEDSAAGVQGARAAGMTVLAITNSLPPDRLEPAHFIVHDYDELRQLLLPEPPS